MDSGTILIIKQELVDKDLPTLRRLNNLNSKIILKEKLVTVSLIPSHQQDIMKKRHYWRLDSKSITMFKVKKMFKVGIFISLGGPHNRYSGPHLIDLSK